MPRPIYSTGTLTVITATQREGEKGNIGEKSTQIFYTGCFCLETKLKMLMAENDRFLFFACQPSPKEKFFLHKTTLKWYSKA
jgi:hypothetical protein